MGDGGFRMHAFAVYYGERERKKMKARKEEPARKSELGLDRLSKRTSSDIENGEICADKVQKGRSGKRGRKGEAEKRRIWGLERKKELNRGGGQHAKSSPRWESGQQRNVRISSKIVDDQKNVHSNGKDHTRDYTSGSRLKRFGNDSDSCEWKHSADFTGLKSRRLSDDSYRHVHSENYSRRSVERSYRNNNPQNKESPRMEPPPEELPSMEEDMDICDTPPHVPVVTDLSSGKWFYLDYGVENGPAKLCDISVTIDAPSFPSVVSDTITQLVNPPEAPGNLLADTADIIQSGPANYQEIPAPSPQPPACPNDSVLTSEHLDDLHIDERVRNLLEEALQMNFEYAKGEGFGDYEGFPWHVSYLKEDHDSSGDWKEDDAQDRYSRRKLVLNNGFPLCQMPKSGCEDPRWPQKDDLYFPSQSKRLDLPLWAFCADERVDCSAASRSVQSKLASVRGVKGNVLSVVRINACVVKDQGSLVFESRHKTRGKDRHHSRSTRPLSSTSDSKRSSAEEDSQSKALSDHGSCWSMEFISIPKDHLCTVHELQLHLGDWYYLDGSGVKEDLHHFGATVFSRSRNYKKA
ncbi:histone-lysine N-methyltransferase ATXR3-like isoform X1 [Sesbania bispinosa]|nr:histone-lysine N-methyltransferase ATXR3-like isoform X1 [Sesbania bispinosa]